jgi:hypothetical protein
MINAPVLHVNGDHPEGMFSLDLRMTFLVLRSHICVDVARAMDIAFRYRDYFRKVRTSLNSGMLSSSNAVSPGHHRGPAGLSSMVSSFR